MLAEDLAQTLIIFGHRFVSPDEMYGAVVFSRRGGDQQEVRLGKESTGWHQLVANTDQDLANKCVKGWGIFSREPSEPGVPELLCFPEVAVS